MTTDVPGDRWAEASTMLGLLQRGRGAGYQEALANREHAASLVVDCIANDPRWDHQVEDRGWFYAALVAELNVDLARLRAAFAEPPDQGGDDAAWLATEVFELTARRGIPGGVTELRRYLRSGRDFDQALQHLLPLADHPEAAGLLDDVLELADAEQLRDALSWISDFTVAPWPAWRGASRKIEQAAAEVLSWRATGTGPVTGATARVNRAAATRDLLVQTGNEADPGTPASRLVALAGDGGENTLLEIAPALLEDQALRMGVRAAVRRSLWSLTSPKALGWARMTASLHDEGGLAAVHLLSELAEDTDVAQLRHLLDATVAEGNGYIYAQCSLVDGISRLRDTASAGAVEAVFDTTVYSYLRRRCGKSLSVISADFAMRKAVECLHDCESEIRSAAIMKVDTLVMGVCERLNQIAQDPTEEDSCRRAVADRLDSAGRPL